MLKFSVGLGRHRVLVTQPVSQAVLDRLDCFFEVDLYSDDRPLTRDALLDRLLEKAGVLATADDTIDAAMIPQLRSLKAVCSTSTRHDQLDVPALTQAGVMVTTSPTHLNLADKETAALRAAENLIAAFGFGRIGGKPADLVNPELLCDCC